MIEMDECDDPVGNFVVQLLTNHELQVRRDLRWLMQVTPKQAESSEGGISVPSPNWATTCWWVQGARYRHQLERHAQCPRLELNSHYFLDYA